MNHNAINLQLALDWLHAIISNRLDKTSEDITVSPLKFYSEEAGLAGFIATHNPSYEEFVLLILALAPSLQPNFFVQLMATYLPEGGDFPEFGGAKASNHRSLLPTGETAQFIIAGDNLEKRLAVQTMLSNEHWLAKQHILWLEALPAGEPLMSGRLILEAEVVELLTTGVVSQPRFSIDFPAEHLETEMEWDDLVLHTNTLNAIREIENWIAYNDTLLYDWGMHRSLKRGYRSLFYGVSGTGKTLTATLLGKYTGKAVFRIDLSRVVSKYIGETEKNLAKLFDKAEHKNWILFFDEADALFGKRTDIRDAHDKYANQEVAYLLQRIENYNGLVILATNQRGNIDEAFVRRFQSIIHFPIPRAEERYQLWRKALPTQIKPADDIDWQYIATRFELTGAGIISVIHHCALELLANQSPVLHFKFLETAILREYVKEGKVI